MIWAEAFTGIAEKLGEKVNGNPGGFISNNKLLVPGSAFQG
jgi:hypothetical protein